MLTQQQQANQALPEVIRVQAQKGFRAHVEGKFGVVNPGDVVEIPKVLAMELRAAGKAFMTDAELKRQKNYLPERKKQPGGGDPIARQLALLTEAVAALTRLATGTPAVPSKA